MSSKNAKKNVPATKSTNTVVTRKKSAQQNRQLRAKNKKIIKAVVDKVPPKPEIKSTITPSAICHKDTPLKTKVKHLVQLVEQVEYYPDKLKREMCAKKVFLKPKHNFKVIAVANKRKLSVPQKGGIKSTLSLKSYSKSSVKSSTKSNSSSEISMVEMVKLIEDNHTLSDEDFMEILTCPSPVWWEDPPDERYVEDAICTRLPSPSSPVNKSPGDDNKIEKQSINRTSTPTKVTTLIDFENAIEEFKISPKIAEKFNKKKQKLENVLGNIKNVNKTIKNNIPVKHCKKQTDKIGNTKIIKIGKGQSKNVSNTTDEEDLSDMSFNEEEVLKILENMDIPIEQSQDQHFIQSKKEFKTLKNIQAINSLNRDALNKVKVPDILPPLKRKPDLNINNKTKQDYSQDNLDYNLDAVSHSNFRFISDDDLSIVESNSKLNSKNMKIVNISSSLGESSSILDVDSVDLKDYSIKTAQSDDSIILDDNDNNNEFVPKKVINDLSEYITVYKIVSNDGEKNELNSEKLSKSPENSNKADNVRGKLNNFFKKCKSGKRSKKTEIMLPPISVRDIKDLKMEKENSDDQTNGENGENRLKPCDYCVEETENGKKKFSCDSCEKAPIFACALCNFLADNKELYKNHISKCKDVGRITWKNNLIINQT